ncbi:phosphatidylserine synthase 2-like [Mya arenaria]|uniref:phosphatidylserine synthase 2-like n=1 Tax=Mya arenaria TaxID=6604 RepID=UPI0022E0CF4F|nr:phosphatidylserine synthase 2-like [Mya arenaria]
MPEPKQQIYRRLHSATAHNWEEEKNKYKDIEDDGTMTFFWRAHTLTVLLLFSCILVYVAFFEEQSNDSDYNMKRGVTAMGLCFLLFGVTQTPDGPFRRPHPAFWRLILCLSILYELAMVYLLFQSPADARALMKHIDPRLGVPLPEKDYGGNCLIYDADKPEDPWHNFWDKMDGFVATHFFGWWLKTLIIRDVWFCMVISLMFEILEYTLEGAFPNFSECWWDHWIMDALVCNGLGIYLGMKTMNYLSMKPYHWRGMWNQPTYRGMAKRVALQFTPYSWTDFEWRPTSSLIRWCATLAIFFIFLLAELNTFFLKFVLWIPPDNYLNLTRLVFLLFMGSCALREGFQYLDDPTCKKFGRQAWMIIAIIVTEFLVAVRLDHKTLLKPIPTHIALFWTAGIACLIGYTIWKFYIVRDVKNDLEALRKKKVAETIQEEQEKEQPNDLQALNNNKVKKREKSKTGSASL